MRMAQGLYCFNLPVKVLCPFLSHFCLYYDSNMRSYEGGERKYATAR